MCGLAEMYTATLRLVRTLRPYRMIQLLHTLHQFLQC